MKNTLKDGCGRTIEYVRLSVIDRCDLRCFYCIPKGFHEFAMRDEWLSDDEIVRLMGIFTNMGARRVRLTGGEPLLRKHLPKLAGRLRQLPGLEDLSLSTNATQLRDQARDLRQAGVTRLNVSLDSLRPDRFREITGGGELAPVLAGLQAAREAGFAPLKINMVVMKDRNEDEVGDMVRYCLDNDFTLRFIEAMPIGDTGRAANRDWVDLTTVKERLSRQFTLLPGIMPGGGPARYVQVAGSELRIGFITPLSRHFCDTCNRVRVSVEGDLILCLGREDRVSLRDPLRAGATDEEIQTLIRAALADKPKQHDFIGDPGQVARIMAQTGG